MTFWKWSRTAAANATSDSSVNWAEGQAPSSVNDSARGMMAAAAKFRDDISGAIVTAGTTTAYSLSTYQGFDTLAHLDGALICFTSHITNGGNPGSQTTLNVDNLGAKPLRLAPGLDIPSGTLLQGTPYTVTYSNSDSAFYLHNLGSGNPYGVPLGGLLAYIGTAAPNSAFVLPAGQALSRVIYSTLFSLISTSFGAGDGSTTFNLPDLRGRVPAGQDNMGGSAANRIGSVLTDSGTIVGATLGSNGGSATHALTLSEMPVHNHAASDSGHTHGPGARASFLVSGGGGLAALAGGASNDTSVITASGNANITVANAGGGNSHALLQPTIIVNYILRVI